MGFGTVDALIMAVVDNLEARDPQELEAAYAAVIAFLATAMFSTVGLVHARRRVRVFERDELTADVAMASACLPFLYKAVEIDGQRPAEILRQRRGQIRRGRAGIYVSRTPDLSVPETWVASLLDAADAD